PAARLMGRIVPVELFAWRGACPLARGELAVASPQFRRLRLGAPRVVLLRAVAAAAAPVGGHAGLWRRGLSPVPGAPARTGALAHGGRRRHPARAENGHATRTVTCTSPMT